MQDVKFKMLWLWLPLLLWYFVAFLISDSPAFFHRVDSVYYEAAYHWLLGQPLYHSSGFHFVYLPTMAALFSPLALLPLKVFAIIFRLLSIVIFSIAIYQFALYLINAQKKRAYFIMLACSVLLAQPALFEGQMHLLITGLMMISYVALLRKRYWRCALWLSLSLVLKPTSIVLYLLALAIYGRVRLKLLLITLLFLGAIFFTQSPHYVASQYISFAQTFLHAMYFDSLNPDHWSTLFGAIAFFTHYSVHGSIQFELRVLLALGVLALAWRVKSKLIAIDAIFFIFALGMSYLILFNSRTENNDYVMIAPIIAFTLSLAVNSKRYWSVASHIVMIVLMTINWNLCQLISPENNRWLNPMVVLFYLMYLIWQIRCALLSRTKFSVIVGESDIAGESTIASESAMASELVIASAAKQSRIRYGTRLFQRWIASLRSQ